MASVWRAIRTDDKTEVALKLLGANHAADPDSSRRFAKEAQLLRRLTAAAPHVVEVLDHGVDPTLGPYMVMELLSGETLADRLKRRRRLPPAETVRIVGELCKALSVAHSLAIVHRDVKPANVFLHKSAGDVNEVVKLLDFGVAKHHAGSDLAAHTRAGTVVGTLHYMSPEQLRGERRVDARADLWSVGVIAYRMLVGHAPFSVGPTSELAARVLAQDPTPPSTLALYLPKELDAWVEKALAKQPDQRFDSAQGLILALADALATPCDTATQPNRSVTQKKRHAKGVNLIDLVKLLKIARREGRLGELSAEDAALLDERVLVSDWYPIESFWRLLELAHERVLNGSDDMTVMLGVAGATNVMGSVHAAYVSKEGIDRAARRFERGWASYFDFGSVKVTHSGGVVRFTIQGYPDIPRIHALTTLGWLRATFTLVGLEPVRSVIVAAPWAGADELVYELQVDGAG